MTGFLAPQADTQPDVDDPEAQGELPAGNDTQTEDGGSTEPDSKRRQHFPASMGLSVFLPPKEKSGADHVEVEVRWADYVREDVAEDHEAKTQRAWKRVPRGPYAVKVPLDAKALASTEGVRWPESTMLCFRGELREFSGNELEGLPPVTRVLSLFLVNARPQLERDRDLNFAFQVGFTLRYARGFLRRPNRRGEDARDDDQRVLALMFRDRFEYAVGHNTSVRMPKADDDGVVRALSTTQLPAYEVRNTKHVPVPGIETAMRKLSEMDGAALEAALTPLATAYAAWIKTQREAKVDRAELGKTRDSLMDRASTALTRMREGIELLAKNDEVREAFRIANLAMHAAALQTDKSREDKRYVNGKQPTWRPFQLAFILLNLASVADPAHKDRETADLIYFPTGGGKTEAYLGLIAFALVLRPMRGKARPDEGRGVAVILRYTLRLLTLDQLGRAATLMCALEELRRRDPKRLGNTRFTVGLWVGKTATANRLKDVNAALNDFTSGRTDSPFPLTTCPWCGANIKNQNIKLVDAEGKPSKTKFERVVVYCDAEDCLYTERKRPGQGLPVVFVDEQIYKEVPDFLVATVDKFAMMPWLTDAGTIFGRVTHLDPTRVYSAKDAPPVGVTPLPTGLLPPELIVQDELHLIARRKHKRYPIPGVAVRSLLRSESA